MTDLCLAPKARDIRSFVSDLQKLCLEERLVPFQMSLDESSEVCRKLSVVSQFEIVLSVHGINHLMLHDSDESLS